MLSLGSSEIVQAEEGHAWAEAVQRNVLTFCSGAHQGGSVRGNESGREERIIEAIFTSIGNCLQCLLWHLTSQQWLKPASLPSKSVTFVARMGMSRVWGAHGKDA